MKKSSSKQASYSHSAMDIGSAIILLRTTAMMQQNQPSGCTQLVMMYLVIINAYQESRIRQLATTGGNERPSLEHAEVGLALLITCQCRPESRWIV
jgi:hypothetical protein